jgi:hypothetical protein
MPNVPGESLEPILRLRDHLTMVRDMKAVLATLLLLLQAQPMLGAVVCLGPSRQSAEQCQMPEHGKMIGASVSQPGPSSSSEKCAASAVCTPAPLAIPALVGAADSPLPLAYLPAIASTSHQLGIPPAPPFHPPRA